MRPRKTSTQSATWGSWPRGHTATSTTTGRPLRMRGSYAPPRWLRGESTWRGAREASSTWRLRRTRAWSTGASREASTLHSSRKSTSLSPTGRRVQSHHLSPGPKRRTRPPGVYPALQESAARGASVRFRMPSEKRRASRLRLAAEGEVEGLQPGAGPAHLPRHAARPALHLEATAPWYRGALGEEEGQARPAVGHVEGVQLRHPRVGHEVGQQHHFVPVLVEVPPVREDECAAARHVCARCEAGEGPGTVHPGESVRAPDTVPPGVLVVRGVPRAHRPLRGGGHRPGGWGGAGGAGGRRCAPPRASPPRASPWCWAPRPGSSTGTSSPWWWSRRTARAPRPAPGRTARAPRPGEGAPSRTACPTRSRARPRARRGWSRAPRRPRAPARRWPASGGRRVHSG